MRRARRNPGGYGGPRVVGQATLPKAKGHAVYQRAAELLRYWGYSAQNINGADPGQRPGWGNFWLVTDAPKDIAEDVLDLAWASWTPY